MLNHAYTHIHYTSYKCNPRWNPHESQFRSTIGSLSDRQSGKFILFNIDMLETRIFQKGSSSVTWHRRIEATCWMCNGLWKNLCGNRFGSTVLFIFMPWWISNVFIREWLSLWSFLSFFSDDRLSLTSARDLHNDDTPLDGIGHNMFVHKCTTNCFCN